MSNSTRTCRCGSSEHRTIANRSCPLNRNNVAMAFNTISQNILPESNGELGNSFNSEPNTLQSNTNNQTESTVNTIHTGADETINDSRLENVIPQRRQYDTINSRNLRPRILANNTNATETTTNQRSSALARHNLGSMNVECPNCHSLMWLKEKSAGTNANPVFSICCNKGKVNLPLLSPTNNQFARLLKGESPMSTEFKNRIISYNSALSFTSTGRTLDESVANNRNGAYCYRIQGQFYHLIGSLYPHENNIRPQYAQIYIYDPEVQLDHRINQRGHLNHELLAELQTYLLQHNPYAAEFQHMHEVFQNNTTQESLHLHFRAETQTPDRRRYNAPRVDEVAALLLESPTEATCRDIIIRPRNPDRALDRISEMNMHYDPMHYVLMFPEGDNGWHINIQWGNEVELEEDLNDNANVDGNSDVENGDDGHEQTDEQTEQVVMGRQRRNAVTVMMYYSYRLMYRVNENNQNCMHLYGRLFQKYIVDMYAKLEQNRLNYIRNNQTTLRSELYNRISDAIRPDDTDMANVGRLTILPSSFIGGPRHFTQLYQDALDMCRRLNGPHLFITFTCNPRWPEITNELLHGQTASDRPDLVDRVFYMKFKELLKDLTKRNVMGRCIGNIAVIEFQKRGLPHAHVLLILHPDDVPRTADAYDRLVCAEIPDPEHEPQLYATITNHMLHTRCDGILNGNIKCRTDNSLCSKRFPKPLSNETQTQVNGYPIYRRRNLRTFIKNGVQYNDQWVVPYNRFLGEKYDAHINVEITCSVKCVKYLYKYVYKGHDRAQVMAQRTERGETNRNEIAEYLDARYISPNEGCWRIFGFKLHWEYPHHQRLQVHLQNEQLTYFRDTDNPADVERRPARETTLTAYFEYNRTHQNSDPEALTILYPDFPKYFTWNQTSRSWHRRRRGIDTTMGRIYNIPIQLEETFCLRLLLMKKSGATSFEDMRTIAGVVYNTYREAAVAMGLLSSNNELSQCLQEASTYGMPPTLRLLFASILLFCDPVNPYDLWLEHRVALTEDYLHRHNASLNENARLEEPDDDMYGMVLLDIEDELTERGSTLRSRNGFILPDTDLRNQNLNLNQDFEGSRIMREHGLLIAAARLAPPVDVSVLNEDQLNAFNTIITSSNSMELGPNVYFLDSPGGGGKTYLFSLLLTNVRQSNNVAIAVASSGTAATLLPGGRTAHSMFRIPLVVDHQTSCVLTPRSVNAEVIKRAKLIVWDEASMIDISVFEYVDRNLRDIMRDVDRRRGDIPFGGITMVFGGDFRQVLPVVKNAGRSEVVAHCINRSRLWQSVQQLPLTVNMRVQQAREDDNQQLANELAFFSDYLLSIGNGILQNIAGVTSPEFIRIPSDMILNSENITHLIQYIFPTFDEESFQNSAILTPTNSDVNRINNIVLDELFEGEISTLYSIDSYVNEEDQHQYPSEFLNSLNYGGLPQHALRLKVGCPIMLLRNLNPTRGLCNGTRLICRDIQPHVIRATILTGSHIGDVVFIPRIELYADEKTAPIPFKRYQFPLRPAFCMTINKAQGQTLDRVGIYLPDHVFSHGQLYVALSRARQASSIKFSINKRISTLVNQPDTDPSRYTKNVVFTEVYRGPYDQPLSHHAETT